MMQNTCAHAAGSQNPEKQPPLVAGKQANGRFQVRTNAGGWRAVWLIIASQLVIGPTGLFGQSVFQWSNMKIGGGGYFTGLIIHPANPEVMYARTDVGGALAELGLA